MEKNITEIIKRLMAYYGLNRQDFAKKYGVDPSQVTRWLNEGQIPSGEIYLKLYNDFNAIKDKELPILYMFGDKV